jgi:replicative DNA helicase
MMLQESVCINRVKEVLGPDDFQDERTARIVSLIFDLDSQGKPVEPQHLINQLCDDEVARVICELTLSPEFQEQDRDKIIDDCTRRLKHEGLQLRKRRLHEEIKAAQLGKDDRHLRRLIEEFQDLAKVTTRETKKYPQRNNS